MTRFLAIVYALVLGLILTTACTSSGNAGSARVSGATLCGPLATFLTTSGQSTASNPVEATTSPYIGTTGRCEVDVTDGTFTGAAAVAVEGVDPTELAGNMELISAQSARRPAVYTYSPRLQPSSVLMMSSSNWTLAWIVTGNPRLTTQPDSEQATPPLTDPTEAAAAGSLMADALTKLPKQVESDEDKLRSGKTVGELCAKAAPWLQATFAVGTVSQRNVIGDMSELIGKTGDCRVAGADGRAAVEATLKTQASPTGAAKALAATAVTSDPLLLMGPVAMQRSVGDINVVTRYSASSSAETIQAADTLWLAQWKVTKPSAEPLSDSQIDKAISGVVDTIRGLT